MIPLKRMASTNEVADKILLATEKNTLISGQIINISGGNNISAQQYFKSIQINFGSSQEIKSDKS